MGVVPHHNPGQRVVNLAASVLFLYLFLKHRLYYILLKYVKSY